MHRTTAHVAVAVDFALTAIKYSLNRRRARRSRRRRRLLFGAATDSWRMTEIKGGEKIGSRGFWCDATRRRREVLRRDELDFRLNFSGFSKVYIIYIYIYVETFE